MQGIFFSIATIAATIIIETAITNWRYVGGASGIQLQRPAVMAPFDNYVEMLFFVQAVLVVLAVAISRYIQNSWIGRGLQALKDDELAAECTGVPTLRLKLMACVISGALMCAARRARRHVSAVCGPRLRIQPELLGLGAGDVADRRHRALGGPGDRRILLGVTQQLLTVTISSEVNVLVLGVMLVLFVVAAPGGHHRPGRENSPQTQRGRRMMAGETQAPLLRISALTKRFGGFTALDNVSVDIPPGQRFGLIGPNGSGKTTLINCISGAFRTEPGTVTFRDEDITRLPPHIRTRRGIARSFQIPRPFRSMTVAENLMVGLDFAADTSVIVSEAHRREAMMSILTRMGLASKANVSRHQTQPGRAAQDGAGARDGDAPETADFRRGHGRPFQLGGRRGARSADEPGRSGHHHHHDRAHHAGGDAVFRARDVPRGRQDHLRSARRTRSWPTSACRRPILALSLAIKDLDAGYGAVKALRGVSRSMSSPARPSPCSAPTATARAR